jgi:FkbM family methyltransferase
MIRENILKGLKYIREGGIKYFLCRFVFFIIYRKNEYLGNLKYTFARIRTKEGDFPKIIVNDNSMCIDVQDKGICKELYIYRKREQFSTEFIKKFITENEVIIDIGSNIGYYALIEAQVANRGEVYCIEPVSTNVEILKRNIELNHYNNISVFQYAIGDKDGKGRMYICDKCNISSFIKKPETNLIREIEVPLMTLDKFVERYVHCYPTFIRMDVEGYEYQIIKGSSKILKKTKSLKIYIELHPHLMRRENMIELLDILKQNSFEARAIFLEPDSSICMNIALINKLRRVIELPEFGYIGEGYKKLEQILLGEGICVNVFFEKVNCSSTKNKPNQRKYS